MQSFPPVGGGPIITPDDVKVIVEDIVLFCVMPTFLFMIFVYFYFRQIKQRSQIRNKSVHTELEISPPLYENNNETKFKSIENKQTTTTADNSTGDSNKKKIGLFEYIIIDTIVFLILCFVFIYLE